ncbi:hypothetical protein K3726_04190 [Leisingera caerulea]|nr:hypothetical protein K3726_04190 [Leisingera caerulea]
MSCRSNPGCIRADYAGVMRAVVKFELVTVIADPSDASGARAALEGCGNIEILEMPINDACLRDSGRIGKAVPRPQNCGRGQHLYRARWRRYRVHHAAAARRFSGCSIRRRQVS